MSKSLQEAARVTPQDFLLRYPKYKYVSGKGKENVQWREAALDMCAERDALASEQGQPTRDELIAALRDFVIHEGYIGGAARVCVHNARALLARCEGGK